MRYLNELKKARWLSSFLFLIALFLVTGMVNPDFLTYSNIITCFNGSVVFALLAIGIAFVIMTGEIDVSIGAVMGLTATMAGQIAKRNGNILEMLVFAVLVGMLVGAMNGIGVSLFRVPSLIFTLGVNGALRGLIYIVSGGKTTENFAGAFTKIGNQVLFAEVTIYLAIIVVIIVVIHLLLTKTKKGKYFIAVGDNSNGAMLVGISVMKTKMLAYVICGIFAGLAGVVFASKYGQVNIVAGTGYEMCAIAACVLGGISLSGGLGNILGAAFGAVIMSSVSRMLVFIHLPSNFNNTLTGVMLLIIVVADALVQRHAVESARRKRLLSRTAALDAKVGGTLK